MEDPRRYPGDGVLATTSGNRTADSLQLPPENCGNKDPLQLPPKSCGNKDIVVTGYDTVFELLVTSSELLQHSMMTSENGCINKPEFLLATPERPVSPEPQVQWLVPPIESCVDLINMLDNLVIVPPNCVKTEMFARTLREHKQVNRMTVYDRHGPTLTNITKRTSQKIFYHERLCPSVTNK